MVPILQLGTQDFLDLFRDDLIASYLKSIMKRRVFPDVVPGYKRKLVPEEATIEGEKYDATR